MEEHGNKTIMCSVLFLDIAEYSKKSVSGQIALKDGFNAFLAAAIRNVPVDDRIILDTGDGAAISFLGDVEDALKTALNMREKLLAEGVHMDPPLVVRMGINLGPVRLVKDINGQPNIVGDGINVAQRIMGFANADQILVSRSYYEAVSRLSQKYVGMFDYQGSRTDKHVREHEVYSIGHSSDVIAARQETGEQVVSEMAGAQSAAPSESGWMQAARSTFQNAPMQQQVLYVAAFAGALLLLVVVAVKAKHPSAPPLPKPAEAPVSTVAQAASEAAAVPPKMAAPIAGKPKAEQEKSRLAPADQKQAGKQTPSIRTLKQTTAAESRAEALVSIAVTPWGEVYLDGRMQGVSPPLVELHVAPGKHEIEIRNTIFPAYIQKIHVNADEKIKIKHKFAN